MKPVLLFSTGVALLGLASASVSLHAQTETSWQGAHFGIFAGETGRPDSSRSDRFLFDTNLDGNFGDTVRTAAGADAFSPGSCSGESWGRTPAERCQSDERANEWGIRAGYDWQRNNLVYGLVGEYARTGIEDSVTSFSTTPAFYTMTRDVERMISLRGRIGLAFGEGNNNLVYVVGGVSRAKINSSHTTSNDVNTFTDNGNNDVSGSQYGIGFERRLNDNISLGIEYLDMEFRDDKFRVRAAGPAPASNPFILDNPAGTDFRRSDRDLGVDSVRLMLTYRFTQAQ